MGEPESSLFRYGSAEHPCTFARTGYGDGLIYVSDENGHPASRVLTVDEVNDLAGGAVPMVTTRDHYLVVTVDPRFLRRENATDDEVFARVVQAVRDVPGVATVTPHERIPPLTG
jgi:hypothetical protein